LFARPTKGRPPLDRARRTPSEAAPIVKAENKVGFLGTIVCGIALRKFRPVAASSAPPFNGEDGPRQLSLPEENESFARGLIATRICRRSSAAFTFALLLVDPARNRDQEQSNGSNDLVIGVSPAKQTRT
jgi:hypothetical protein